MSTVTVRRPPRVAGPTMPEGQIELQEPPVLAEPAAQDVMSVAMYLPMGLGGMVMLLAFSGVGGASPMSYIMGAGMGIAMISMGIGQVGRAAMERKRKMAAERRDYLRHIGQLRDRARRTADEQRAAVLWNNPNPRWLWHIAGGLRLWERRASHEDFARVRIGLGTQTAALELIAPTTKPIEDLEPLSAVSLRRFSEAFRTVSGIPIAVGLRSFTSVELAGELGPAVDLARAMIAQLVTFHAPDELRVAVLTTEESRPEWEWVKWLPHNAHPTARDAVGPARMVATDHDELMDLLGPAVTDRGPHEKGSLPGVAEPFVVVVAHLANVPDSSRLLDAGLRNVVLLDITGMLPGGEKVLRLTATDDRVEFPSGDGQGSAQRDALSMVEGEVLARSLAPRRTSGTVDLVEHPLESDFELTTLLGIRDINTFDVSSMWRHRSAQSARMAVPIGVTDDGEIVELDLKESAQGGMGPHGMLIGATGSGKSELLRTLVLGLAATHSSEILNFVLVDFKGGATFLGMDRLPHTSAMITNLADELPLVDRMQDSLNGELIRRQELLRQSGLPSQFEYEKARASGQQLAPFPTLFIVVDEFSELLASKPEFMDLFVSIGRLGRSLGVHLLLASQRLDEGRTHRVEGHLSYRIALRTFSSMESRNVIGVANAYELPSEPGNGYLKIDTTNLVRFKAAYVSGAVPLLERDSGTNDHSPPSQEIVPFDTHPHRMVEASPLVQDVVLDEPQDEAEKKEGTVTLAEAFITRLTGAGPAARQVWLPPLAESPSLDSLLPSVLPDPVRGMTVEDPMMRGALRAPIGTIDRPYEQMRDLMIVDLIGADGHVGVVGATQSGKSTLLRTLVLSLAMTHTPEEVQFYGLDFGGGGIMSINGLPHVGSVATRLERDRVVRTIEQMLQVLEAREAEFTRRGIESMTVYRNLRRSGEIDDAYGDVFLVIDGWFSIRQDYSDLEPKITELATRGLAFGLHIVVANNRWSEIRPALRDLIGTKYELRLGDPMESEVGSRKAATVPSQPGRGLTRDGLHFLAALPRMDGRSATSDLAEATKAIAEETATFWPGAAAPAVRLLPAHLPAADLQRPDGDIRICLGRDEQRLAPVWQDFEQTPHMLVFGDSETGKTNALRQVLGSITGYYSPAQAKIVLGDPSRQLDDLVPEPYRLGYAVAGDTLRNLAGGAGATLSTRVPGQDITSERLRKRDWWTGPRVFFVVDDYELLTAGPGSPLEPLLPLLAQGAHIGLHLVMARSTSSAMRAMSDPVIRRLWELGSPALVYSYPKEEGKFIGEAVPRRLVPGRAQLVTRRGVKLVQTAYVDPAPAWLTGGGPR